MKSLTLFLAILTSTSFLACSQKSTKSTDITYYVQANYAESLNLAVNFKYQSNANGELLLRFENSSWGDNDIYNCIENFQVYPKPEHIEFNRDSSFIKIETKPNSYNSIKYTIKQDFQISLRNHHRYRPIITKNYFHILGMRLFIFPDNLFESEESKASIDIIWNEFPKDALFHSSFGFEKKQHIHVSQDDLYGSFFVGGDFRRKKFLYKNKPVYFVTRGKWKNFTDDDVYNSLKETVSFQNNFWKDSIKTRFSVSLLPTEEKDSYSVGGSGFSNSFVSFASNNIFTGIEKIDWLYNHELLHKWIGRTIKNEDEVKQYWFSEGFTDYYAYKLLLKNNKTSLEDFIETLNTTILEHHNDKINSIPNSDLTFEKYWSNYTLYQNLPYRRGLLYAFLIDSQIKIKSNFTKSLDHLMLDILKQAHEVEEMRINNDLFKKMLVKHLDNQALINFEKYILEGKLIQFKNQLINGLSIDNIDGIPNIKIDNSKNTTLLKSQLKF